VGPPCFASVPPYAWALLKEEEDCLPTDSLPVAACGQDWYRHRRSDTQLYICLLWSSLPLCPYYYLRPT